MRNFTLVLPILILSACSTVERKADFHRDADVDLVEACCTCVPGSPEPSCWHQPDPADGLTIDQTCALEGATATKECCRLDEFDDLICDQDCGGVCGDLIAGQRWAACPVDKSSGVYTLCDEGNACVPADGGSLAVCAPLGDCVGAPSGTSGIGYGGACYARCELDDDCFGGMACGEAIADGSRMCAWPVN